VILSEVRRIVGRRGMFWSAVLISSALVALLAVLALTQDTGGGADLLADIRGSSLVATIMVILLGALTGSYDAVNGTMRYLVLTGVPRWRLYLNRLAGFVLAALAACLPSLLLGFVAAAAIPSRNPADLGDHAATAWTYLLTPVVFGLFGVAVGSLLRSNGGAIGLALSLYLGGYLLSQFVAHYVNETVAAYLLPDALAVVAFVDRGAVVPVYAAALAVLAWITVFASAGAWRVHHDEY